MKKIFVPVLAAILLAFMFLGATPVLGNIPALPHAFYGSVYINGAPAPDGTLVSATVDSGTVLNNVQHPVATAGGKYGSLSLPLLVQGDIPNGAVITFHVACGQGAVAAGTAIFQAGGGPTLKDLSATIATTTPTPTTTTPTTTTTTTTTTPNPTTTTPPPTHSGASGGASTPSPTATRVLSTPSITGFNSTGPLQLDEDGIVHESTVLYSQDGGVFINISAGTSLLDSGGQPLSEFVVGTPAISPPPPPDCSIAVVYEFGPDGAVFNPPITMYFALSPEDLPEGADLSALVIAWWNGSEWVLLDTDIDTSAGKAICRVDHFTTFALVLPVAREAVSAPVDVPVDTPSTEPAVTAPSGTAAEAAATAAAASTETADKGISPGLIAGIAGGVIAVILVLVLATRRRY